MRTIDDFMGNIMANGLSSLKMTDIKTLVSKNRVRYQEDGYDLDLTYITSRIIAMGFPAKGLEQTYRNGKTEVFTFMRNKHGDNFKVYNLCSERKDDKELFTRIADYPFKDHNPPDIKLILQFVEDVHEWLSQDEKNVAAIHCKAGKGRTGTMISCYLLYSKFSSTADEALNFYATKRTKDRKGVTIPSQRRYVQYYEQLLKSDIPYSPVKLQILSITFSKSPLKTGILNFSINCVLKGEEVQVYESENTKKLESSKPITFTMDHCIPLEGDVKIKLFKQGSKLVSLGTKEFCHFWFNTFFINKNKDMKLLLELRKEEIDDVHKDKKDKYNSFVIRVEMQRIPSDTCSKKPNLLSNDHCNNHSQSNIILKRTPSQSPEASSSTSSSAGEWDTGELDINTSDAVTSSIFIASRSTIAATCIPNTIQSNISVMPYVVDSEEKKSLNTTCNVAVNRRRSIAFSRLLKFRKNRSNINEIHKDSEPSLSPNCLSDIEYIDKPSHSNSSSFKKSGNSTKGHFKKITSNNIKNNSNNHTINNNIRRRMKWLMSIRSDPDMQPLGKSVHVRLRQSNDSLVETSRLQSIDYYSNICDNQLSIESPNKSQNDTICVQQSLRHTPEVFRRAEELIAVVNDETMNLFTPTDLNLTEPNYDYSRGNSSSENNEITLKKPEDGTFSTSNCFDNRIHTKLDISTSEQSLKPKVQLTVMRNPILSEVNETSLTKIKTTKVDIEENLIINPITLIDDEELNKYVINQHPQPFAPYLIGCSNSDTSSLSNSNIGSYNNSNSSSSSIITNQLSLNHVNNSIENSFDFHNVQIELNSLHESDVREHNKTNVN